jgi:hypothetical protein
MFITMKKLFALSTILLSVIFTSACSDVSIKNKTSKTIEPIHPFVCLTSQSLCVLPSSYGDIAIEFSGDINDGRVVTEQEFLIKATFKPLLQSNIANEPRIAKISGYMEGKEMFMGKIPVFFETSPTQKNVYLGRTLTASCSEDTMVWLLHVDIEWEGEKENILPNRYELAFESIRRE